MLNRLASLALSTSILKALPGNLDIKIHSPSILYIFISVNFQNNVEMSSANALTYCILIDLKGLSLTGGPNDK